MNRKYCFLILSCDKNIKLLDFFFEQFFLNLSFDGSVYVMMENMDYHDERVISIRPGITRAWSDRLLYALEQIEEEQILIMCDDHIIEGPVDLNEIDKLSYAIHYNQNLGNIIFTEIVGNSYKKRYFGQYLLRTKYGKYRTALQVGLWRREFLKRITIKGENPWSFEIFSNMRSFLQSYKCLALSDNKLKPIVYNDGYFVIQGKIFKQEKDRLESVLNRKIIIEDFEEWEGKPPRDNVSFYKRLKRRIKIIKDFGRYFICSFKSCD